MGDDRRTWLTSQYGEDDSQFAEEAASAYDLCTALCWHRANIAQTLPVVDDDGDAQRMAEVRQVIAALGRACEAVATYYDLPGTATSEADRDARGAPPRLIDG